MQQPRFPSRGRIKLRLSGVERALIAAAAKVQGRKVSDFMLDAARNEASRVLAGVVVEHDPVTGQWSALLAASRGLHKSRRTQLLCRWQIDCHPRKP